MTSTPYRKNRWMSLPLCVLPSEKMSHAVLPHRADDRGRRHGAAERRRVEVALAAGREVKRAALDGDDPLAHHAPRGSRRGAPRLAPCVGGDGRDVGDVLLVGLGRGRRCTRRRRGPAATSTRRRVRVSRPPEKAMPMRVPFGGSVRWMRLMGALRYTSARAGNDYTRRTASSGAPHDSVTLCHERHRAHQRHGRRGMLAGAPRLVVVASATTAPSSARTSSAARRT